ncbi:selenocysteine lyase/cysteine desulfurase [Litorimonas taeanensis]|uniref:Selenocysteine lyase/cysteine desulfurase n=2 Tax=Litorimonas taeanensis TaxID=568099 RepID=A0A420WLY7_9PROT|nr:selenocysteine lyase/cysteine desulfurase [Litorimonas taeanensis]
MDIQSYFHVPNNYFLSHSVGCLPKTTQSRVTDAFFSPWQSGESWTEWMPLLENFRNKLGYLLGTKAANICPQTNISSALTKILYSLPSAYKKGTIVLSKQDFPTIGFVLKQAERSGFTLKFVEGDPTDISGWADAIDSDTSIVHITHALSNTSHLLPVKSICTLAKKVNAISIVDIAQSIGAVATPLAEWNCDFAMGSGVKFLCAGPGACFLYASETMITQCEPIDVGWFSHENPFEMNIESFRYANDAMRFFGGTPSPLPIVAANAALTLWQEIGQKTVYETIQNHLNHLTRSLPNAVMISPTDPEKRGATLVINPQDRPPLRKALELNAIRYDERQDGFRFSVHGYTPDTDVRTLADLLNDALV